MSRPSSFSWAARLLALLTPRQYREAVLGDLAEERALRSFAESSETASRWYRYQLAASALPLLWARITRWAWPSTVALCLGAYVAGALIESVVDRGFAELLGPGPHMGISVAIVLSTIALVAFCATRLHSQVRVLFPGIIVVDFLVRLAGESVHPTWYLITILFAGPTVAAASGQFAMRRSS